jgi:hypothetical protein
MSGFINYLIMYYSKYFQGNFFFLYSILGQADSISLFWVGLISKKFKVIGVIVLTISCVIGLCISEVFISRYVENNTILMTLIIFFIRMLMSSV